MPRYRFEDIAINSKEKVKAFIYWSGTSRTWMPICKKLGERCTHKRR